MILKKILFILLLPILIPVCLIFSIIAFFVLDDWDNKGPIVGKSAKWQDDFS